MNLQNLFSQAYFNYDMFIKTGVKSYKEKATTFYQAYTNNGGKKIIKGLED